MSIGLSFSVFLREFLPKSIYLVIVLFNIIIFNYLNESIKSFHGVLGFWGFGVFEDLIFQKVSRRFGR